MARSFELRCGATRAGTRGGPGAFTLVELLVVIAVVALLVAILLPSLAEARKGARQMINYSNLRNYVTSTQSYSSDFQDRIWAFTWRAGRPTKSQFPDLQNPNDDIQAAHFQAVDIIRRRAQPEFRDFPTQGAWIPHVFYSHLVMLDYMAARLPEPITHSPFDKLRARWREDPIRAAKIEMPAVGRPPRWPYSSSYETTPSSYTPDRETSDGGSLRQAGSSGVYIYNEGSRDQYRLGNRRLSDVAFPNQKVHSFEQVARQIGRKEYYYNHPQAQVTLSTYGGSVTEVKSRDMNLGGYLGSTGTGRREVIRYDAAPEVGLPPWPDNTSTTQPARCRWTVGGIKGVDFGAKEPFRIL